MAGPKLEPALKMPGSTVTIRSPWNAIGFDHRTVAYDDKAFTTLLRELGELVRLSRARLKSKHLADARMPLYEVYKFFSPGQRRRLGQGGALLAPQDAALILRLGAWEEKYCAYLEFVCPANDLEAELFRMDGCDTPRRLKRFWQFVRLHQALRRRMNLGRRRKYSDDLREKLRSRKADLMSAGERVVAEQKSYAKKHGVGLEALPPAAIRPIANKAGIKDIPFVREIVRRPEVRLRKIVEERLLREFPMPKEQLWSLIYRRTDSARRG